MSEPSVSVRNLTKSFGERKVVDMFRLAVMVVIHLEIYFFQKNQIYLLMLVVKEPVVRLKINWVAIMVVVQVQCKIIMKI